MTTEQQIKHTRRNAFYEGKSEKNLSELLADAKKRKENPEIKSLLTSNKRDKKDFKEVETQSRRERIIQMGKDIHEMKRAKTPHSEIVKILGISHSTLIRNHRIYLKSLK